jgi:hypothetical protein
MSMILFSTPSAKQPTNVWFFILFFYCFLFVLQRNAYIPYEFQLCLLNLKFCRTSIDFFFQFRNILTDVLLIQLVELHVFYVPEGSWNYKLNTISIEVINKFISAGFIR